MTKAELKEKRRANRRIKRRAEHQERMVEKREEILAEAAEIDRRELESAFGRTCDGRWSDPTPLLAVRYMNSKIPECDRIYVRGPKLC